MLLNCKILSGSSIGDKKENHKNIERNKTKKNSFYTINKILCICSFIFYITKKVTGSCSQDNQFVNLSTVWQKAITVLYEDWCPYSQYWLINVKCYTSAEDTSQGQNLYADGNLFEIVVTNYSCIII